MGCQYFSPCEHGADSFTVAIPKLTFGRGCLEEAGVRAAQRGMTRVALFTDAFLKDGSYVSTVQQSLREASLDFSAIALSSSVATNMALR